MADDRRSGLPPSPRRRRGEDGEAEPDERRTGPEPPAAGAGAGSPPPPPSPPARPAGGTPPPAVHAVVPGAEVEAVPPGPARGGAEDGPPGAPSGVVPHGRDSDQLVVVRPATDPVVIDVATRGHGGAHSRSDADRDIVPHDDDGRRRGGVLPPGDRVAPDEPLDRRPRAGQGVCAACKEGVDRDRYFCRNGHRQRAEDRSGPEEPTLSEVRATLFQRLASSVGPNVARRTRVFRLTAITAAFGTLTAFLLPPFGPAVRSAMTEAVNDGLGRKGKVVAGVSAIAGEEVSGLPAAYAVDGFNRTSWAAKWAPPAATPDEAAACAASPPPGTTELLLTFEPTRVGEVEIVPGVHPDLKGSGQHLLPAAVAVRVGDDECALVRFPTDDVSPATARLSADREISSVAVRIVGVHKGDVAGLTSLREVVLRRAR